MGYIKLGFLLVAVILDITAGKVVFDATSQGDDVLDVGNKRALAWMDEMMSCLTNRTFFQTLLDFGFYGCYCGFGGWGEPVDGVDKCCKTHDECYGATHRSEHGACYTTLAAYLAPYKYSLDKCDTEEASITCATLDKYKWYYPLRKCAVAICKCDSDLAQCIAREPFHKEYRFYDRLKCFDKDDKKKAKP